MLLISDGPVTPAPDAGLSLPATPRRLWESSEEEYVEYRRTQRIKSLQSQLAEERRDLAALRKPASKKRTMLETSIYIHEHLLQDLEAGVDPRQRVEWQGAYQKMIAESISHGRPVSAAIIDGSPDFQTARDHRAIYDKGYRTSYANASEGVDDSMQEERGFKVKYQSGAPVTSACIAEIGAGVTDVESVVGPLGDLMRAANLTIAHTAGKQPFLSLAAGVYHPSERTVSTGWIVPSLGHELAHCLDAECGASLGLSTWVQTAKRAGRTVTYWSECVADLRRDLRPADLAFDRRVQEILFTAAATINHESLIRRALKARLGQVSPEDLREVKRVKALLGLYWMRPREVWARLFEQYVSVHLDHPSTEIGRAHV
jgi:hypothetical protein